jgi:hypothetical protein
MVGSAHPTLGSGNDLDVPTDSSSDRPIREAVPPRGRGERTLRLVWSSGCAALVLWAAVTSATQRTAVFDFYPLNGDFQNFNPIRRWLAGECPGRDFNAYLGLGPTGLMTVATGLLGGDFRASLAAVVGLCVLLQALCWGLVARCGGLSRTAAWSLAAISVLFVAAPYKLWLPRHLQAVLVGLSEHLLKPGNSVLGLRAAAPVLLALGLWLAWRWLDRGSAVPRRVGILGVAGGIVLPWSNDYGLATCFSLFVVSAWALYAETSWRTWLVALLAQALLTLLTAFGVVTLLTGGAAATWFQSAFLGVAEDQFWYFHGRKLVELGDIPFFPSLLCGGLCTLWLAIATRIAPQALRQNALSLLLVLSPLVAALLSMAGGHIEWRYTFPLTRVLYVALPLALAQAVGMLARVIGTVFVRSHGTNRELRLSPDVRTAGQASSGTPGAGDVTAVARPAPFWMRLETLLCIALAVQTVQLARRYAREIDRQPAPQAPYQIDVPELGGRISARFGPTVQLARDLATEFEAQGIPPDRRLLSTYTSLIDLLAGARTPTRADYLIHALGDEERRLYLGRYHARAPARVVTMRDDWDGWEAWLRRQNWEFYRELIKTHAESDRTFYARVWSRLDQPRTPLGAEFSVRKETLDQATVLLDFRLPDSIPADRGPVLCEVELSYKAFTRTGVWSRGVLRRSLEATEIERPFRNRGMSTWGLPVVRRSRLFPIELEPGRSHLVILHLAPGSDSKLSVGTVFCTPLYPVREVDDPPQTRLRVASWTAGPWTNGIARPDAQFRDAAAGSARFLASDLSDLRHLEPGDRLRFFRSGERTITSLEGTRVTVDGPALVAEDAARPVDIVQPRWRPARSTNRDLLLSDRTTPDWRNGICIDADRAGCSLRDAHQLAGLAPGHRLEFAGSGVRRVVQIEGPMVWVEGPALDPLLDGPPETVRWLDCPADSPRWQDWTRPALPLDSE